METAQKMKIAITGAHGFIGKALTLELAKRKISCESFDRQKHDLFNKKSFKDFVSNKDIIFHLAGVNKNGSLEDIVKVNILGTKTLLDAMVAYNKNAKLIFISSFGVYEDHDIFGLSKKLAEELIISYSNKYKIKSIILRCSNIYGVGARPFTNSVIATFSHLVNIGKPITLHGDGTQKRDYLYISDVISALLSSLHLNVNKAETYDICSGTMTSLSELIKIISSVAKKPVSIKKEKSIQIQSTNIRVKLRPLPKWKAKVSLAEGLKIVMNEKI